MKRIINRLKGSFFKSLAVLTGGSAIAMIALAVEQVAIARIFTPEAIGIYAFLISIPHAFLGIICGRYDLTIVYEEKEENVLPLVKLNILINLLITSTVTVGYGVYLLLAKPEYNRFLYLLPAYFIYLFAYGLTNTLNSYNNRYRNYKMISKMHVFRTLAQCGGTVAFGLIFLIVFQLDDIKFGVPSLIIPYCVGMLFGVVSQARELIERRAEIKAIPLTEVWAMAKLHKKQPLLSAPAIFANGFSYSLITIFTEGLYGEAATGYYSLSTKLLGMPISLISGNLSKVFMERAAKEYEKTGGYIRAFRKTLLFLVSLAIPMFFCMYFLAPPVCAWLFGDDWVIAGEYIKILALMFSVRFVATAMSVGLYVCKKQQAELFIQSLFMLITLSAGIVSYVLALDIMSYFLLVSIVRSCVMIIHVLLVYYYARGGYKKKNIKSDSYTVDD